MLMCSKKVVLSAVALVLAAGSVQAGPNPHAGVKKAGPVTGASALGAYNNLPGQDEVLWDQSAFDVGLVATVNQEFNDFPTYSTYAVDDFTTDGATWNVEKITVFFTQGLGSWGPGITSGSLQFYRGAGPLPDNSTDTAPEYKVAVTVTDGGGSWAISADTTGIDELQGINGEFWIGLTPNAEFGVYGQEFVLNLSGFYGENAAIRNPGGAFGFGTDWASNTAIGGQEIAFILEGRRGGEECYADCNGDEILDFFDFLCFLNFFDQQDQYADCEDNEIFDFFDFLCYLNAFDAGC